MSLTCCCSRYGIAFITFVLGAPAEADAWKDYAVRIEARNFDFGAAPVRVRWAFPGEAERIAVWDVCDDGSCIGQWSEQEGRRDAQGFAFLRRLQGAAGLRMTVEPPHVRPISVLFKLDGIDKAMRDLDRNCRRPP